MLSGEESFPIAFSQSAKLTRAMFAKPGIEALTMPRMSLMANIVSQTMRVLSSSCQMLDDTI
jgi:hypothetical protein